MLQKIKSLVFDRRFPYFLLYNYLNSIKIKKDTKHKQIRELKISLTFDIERLPTNNIENPKSFLENISEILDQKKVKGTFFIEGSIMGKFSETIRIIGNRNELGLHGFRHELWGNEKWWNNKKPLNYKKKVYLIDKCLKILEDN
ncbi:MAG: polysaccharide deacetylase family protein, partial [Candidatus Aenigmarchaeota archaeon]|nr:polysaccharide deacetylase family protein [Candidatus Aenigmarchaeota archaeon]